MKTVNRNTALIRLFFVANLLFLFSCRVTFLPAYNAELSKDLQTQQNW